MIHIDIARWRLRNQHISANRFQEPSEAVQGLVAVQAQDYAGAKWALGLRMQAATDNRIEQAFAEGAILRTHVMRPTWHFVSPADIRWLLALTAPRVHAVNAFMYRKLELDERTLKRSQAALVKALKKRSQLTRAEVREVFRNSGIVIDDGLRLGYLLMAAELDGIICSGSRRGKQFTYALLADRAPKAQTLRREEALAELAGRYFLSRGPATIQDFSKWSGLTLTDARRGLEAVQAQLEHEQVGGHEYWFAARLPLGKDGPPTVHLLSIYDEYVSSYEDRSAIGEAKVGTQLTALGNDVSYIIVVDGQIVGTWKRIIRKDGVTIQTNLLIRSNRVKNHAIAVAAQRYSEFLELPVTVV
jgi:hypothetical protein